MVPTVDYHLSVVYFSADNPFYSPHLSSLRSFMYVMFTNAMLQRIVLKHRNVLNFKYSPISRGTSSSQATFVLIAEFDPTLLKSGILSYVNSFFLGTCTSVVMSAY